MSPLDMGAIAALYGDVNTVAEVEVPVFARPAVAPGRAVERDQYGRPKIVPAGESAAVPYTRASSEAGYLTDGNALRIWQTRRLALALARFPDLLMRIAVLRPDPDEELLEVGDAKAELARAKADRGELDLLIERALDRDGTLGKADWGTAMHKLSEPSTPRDYVPEALWPDLLAYDHALASRGIVRVESEVFCVNDRWRIAGTTDGVFDVPGWGRVVGDLKTGQLHPVQHAVQLAAYAGADRFDPDAPAGQQRTPLGVRQDVGLLIHVLKGSGRCDLFLIDLEHGRRNIALAEQVRDARRAAGLARPFDEVVPFAEVADEFVQQLEATEAALEQADPGHLEDAAAAQADGSVQTDLALGAGFPPADVVDPRVQPPAELVDAVAQQVQPPYDNGGPLPAGLTPVTAPAEALGPRLQRQAEHDRLERQRAQARANRDAARATAQDDPEAPMHAKVRTAADVRADLEAAGDQRNPAVERLQRERAEREAAQYREVQPGHPGVVDVPLPTTQQQAPAGPSSSPGESAARAVPQPPPAQPGEQQQATPPPGGRPQSSLGPIPPGTPTAPDGRPLDVNGNPVDVQHDGFDDLRVTDPRDPAGDDNSVARGLVADVLGGVEMTPAQQLAERVALAGSRDEVNALFREFSPRGEWLEEHHRLAQQRVALLGPDA